MQLEYVWTKDNLHPVLEGSPLNPSCTKRFESSVCS